MTTASMLIKISNWIPTEVKLYSLGYKFCYIYSKLLIQMMELTYNALALPSSSSVQSKTIFRVPTLWGTLQTRFYMFWGRYVLLFLLNKEVQFLLNCLIKVFGTMLILLIFIIVYQLYNVSVGLCLHFFTENAEYNPLVYKSLVQTEAALMEWTCTDLHLMSFVSCLVSY